MIDPKRARLPIIRQCTLLHLNQSGVYYRPVPQSEVNLALVRLIDAQFLETPYYGSRQMTWHLRRPRHEVGRKRVRRLMAVMDWHTRKVPSWRLSNTMDAEFCIEALQDVLTRYGAPEIFNTDSQKMVASSRTVCLKH